MYELVLLIISECYAFTEVHSSCINIYLNSRSSRSMHRAYSPKKRWIEHLESTCNRLYIHLSKHKQMSIQIAGCQKLEMCVNQTIDVYVFSFCTSTTHSLTHSLHRVAAMRITNSLFPFCLCAFAFVRGSVITYEYFNRVLWQSGADESNAILCITLSHR